MKHPRNLLLLSALTIICAQGTSAPDKSLSIEPEKINKHVVKIAQNHNMSSHRGSGFGVYDKVANKTWVTWAGENMSAYIREYDHAKKTWSDSQVVGKIPDTEFFQYSWSQQKTDHHNYPKMTQMNDGRLILINSAHNSKLFKSISPKARSADAWNASHYEEIKDGDASIRATYPLVNKSSNGDIYVFYRYTTGLVADYRPLEMIKSTDNGLTFSKPIRVIDTNGALAHNLDEVYNGRFRHEPAKDGRPERFLLGWTMAGGGPINKHNIYHKDAYFAYFHPETGEWSNAAGETFGAEIDEEEIAKCLVFDSGDPDENYKHAVGYHFSPSYTDDGNPILLYTTKDKQGDHLVCARWNGEKWANSKVASNKGGGLMDIERTGPNSFVAFKILGSKLLSFKSNDGGASWSEGKAIQTNITNLNKFGIIKDYHPEMKFLALQADWKERDTSGVYGVYVIKE